MFLRRERNGGSLGGDNDKIFIFIALNDLITVNGLIKWSPERESILQGDWVYFSDGVPVLFDKDGGGLGLIVELKARDR